MSKIVSKEHSRHAYALTLALAAIALVSGGTVREARASINVQDFTPAANSTYTLTEDAMLQVAPYDPTWTGSRLFFSANYNWIDDPLVEYSTDRTVRTATLVDGIQTLDLGVGWFLAQRFSINFASSMDLVHIPSQANQFALGDSQAFFKWRLTGDNAYIAISVMPEIWLPTGDSNLFLSDGSVGYGATLAFEHDFGVFRAAANVGYRYSPNAQYGDIDYTQRMPMALGAFIPVSQHWGINAEAAGALILPVNSYNNPSELYAGARYQVTRECTLLGGASIGSVDSQAGNDFRVSLGIRFSPMPEPKVAEAPKSIPLAPVVAQQASPPPPVVTPKIARVTFTKREIKLTEEIKFRHASAVLTLSGRDLLDEVAEVMKKNRRGYRKILIEGHTNELGSYPYNQKLSEQRAAAVREYLASRGITSKNLLVIGYGKTKPKRKLTDGLSKEARLAANRRVGFRVIN